jgi:hypothetical protein
MINSFDSDCRCFRVGAPIPRVSNFRRHALLAYPLRLVRWCQTDSKIPSAVTDSRRSGDSERYMPRIFPIQETSPTQLLVSLINVNEMLQSTSDMCTLGRLLCSMTRAPWQGLLSSPRPPAPLSKVTFPQTSLPMFAPLPFPTADTPPLVRFPFHRRCASWTTDCPYCQQRQYPSVAVSEFIGSSGCSR